MEADDCRVESQWFESIVITFNLVPTLELVWILEVIKLLSEWMPCSFSHIESQQSGTGRTVRKVFVLVVHHVNFLDDSARRL